MGHGTSTDRNGVMPRIGLIACDILETEFEHIIGDDPRFCHREYVEFALHADPERMRSVLIEKVDALEGQVDAVLLGYATCSSLEGFPDAVGVPTVMLKGADCIEVLLGPDDYAAEKKVCTGTWFSSVGWAREGLNGLIKEMHLDSMEGYDPSFFLDIIFASYSRTLFLDAGLDPTGEFRCKSEAFAGELGLRHDCRCCDLSRIEDTVRRAVELAESIIDTGTAGGV